MAENEYNISPAADPDEAPQEPQGTPVTTAFIVIVKPDGGAVATNDLTALDSLQPQRSAGLEDMHRALLEVEKDISLARAAQETVALISAQAAAMAEAQQQKAVAAQLAQQDLRGGVNLGPRRR